jgi:two-component system, NarL family, response regulator
MTAKKTLPTKIAAPAKRRLMVADDHSIFRAGLAALLSLQPDFEIVAEAATAAEAIDVFRATNPELAIVDLRFPDRSGVDVILTLKAEFPHSCFLILTTFDTDEDLYRGIQAGADGFLLKGIANDELIATIRQTLNGRGGLSAEMGARLARRLAKPSLTAREAEILTALVDGRSNKELASQLFVSEDTVKFHLKGIFQKLGVLDRTQAVVAAVKQGIVKL